MRTRKLVLAALLGASSASAQGYEPPSSLIWPLYRYDAPSSPRPSLGNSFGEYQSFSGPNYLHTGIDIRGATADIVKVVASGNVWVSVFVDDDGCRHDSSCRVYVKGDDDRYIYYYSHLELGPAAMEMTSEVREKIVNATRWDEALGTYPVQPGTDVSAGQVLSEIGPFGTGIWPHLHFAIIEESANYDAVNPLTALQRTGSGVAIIDDERPVIADVALFADGTETPLPLTDACTPISGAVDVAARISDTFYTTDPAPPPYTGTGLSSFGLFEAGYRIQRVGTSSTLSGTWYRFDRAPLRCAGPLRGTSCPTPLNDFDFFQQSFLQPAGGLHMGEPYVNTLFASSLSSSAYLGTESYTHLLTNRWGQDRAWYTASGADGWYQVSAIARDADGNSDARSLFVAVDNHGGFTAPSDVYVRDNVVDVGALPSTLGGYDFWSSPDIFVVPAGATVGIGDTPPEVRLEPDTAYDVYVRVHNHGCTTVSALRTQVYSANPAMILDSSAWVHITPPGVYVPPAGITVEPDDSALLGPFSWTPTAEEALSNEGHRCMLVEIDAPSDPLGTAGVPDNNNFAQRNLQFGRTRFSYGNPTTKADLFETELSCNGFPLTAPGAKLLLRIAYHPALLSAWANAQDVTVSLDGNDVLVGFERCNVRLPPVLLPGLTNLPASFDAILPGYAPGAYTVGLGQYAGGQLLGGMSFRSKQP